MEKLINNKDIHCDCDKDNYHQLVVNLLSLLNASKDEDVLKEMLNLVKEYTGFEAAGIRLQEGENFPYYYHIGFSNSFIEKENDLFMTDQSGEKIRDCNNNLKLECLCGCVLRKRIDPSLPFFSEDGSFFTNSTARLLAKFKDELPSSARAHCRNEGYETLAIIPIRTEKKIIGILQLNDKRKGLLNSEKIKNLEAIGNILGIIYQRKQYEDELVNNREKLEYSKLKTKFFANISHELKTPLNLIFSALQMLNLYKDKNLASEESNSLEGYIKTIKQNANRLLRLANNILDITKIDLGAFNLKLQNIDIVEVIKKVTSSTKDYIENKGRILKLKSDIEEKIIACDPIKIERVLLNLLSNAVKFTDEGDMIKVFVGLDQVQDEVLISVIDTGVGMKKEKQKLVFEEFRQVDETLSRNTEGSGMGLSIVKSLIEMHGGEITLNSEYNEGSEFIIRLPAKTLSAEEDGQNYNYENNLDKVEIEFSDIYE